MSKINTEWFPYYEVLEHIRQSGITNMFGAAPYLAAYCEIDEKLARQVLVNWMENYNDIATIFNWTK
jgi:hypothetical protein